MNQNSQCPPYTERENIENASARDFQVTVEQGTSNRESKTNVFIIPSNGEMEQPNSREYDPPKIASNEQLNQQIQNNGYDSDNEEQDNAFLFTDQGIRRAFVRKVFLLLMILLAKVTGYIAICVYVDAVREFWRENSLYVLAGIPVYFITACMILCCSCTRKTPPWNYILLLTFSTSLAYMVGGICSLVEGDIVMIAFGMTTILCLGLSIFACQTKYDFTFCTAFGVVILVLIPVLLIPTLIWMSRAGSILLSGLAVLLFSIFFIYDVQTIINGKHSYKISPEDYIFAVTVLYIDIIVLFLRILRCLQFFIR